MPLLTSLMQDNGLPSAAEFLSLDVQGAEELVLRAVDPAVFKVINHGGDRRVVYSGIVPFTPQNGYDTPPKLIHVFGVFGRVSVCS